MKPAIGLIGVGLMGHGIASNLLKHGYALTVLEHAGNQSLDGLLAAGARTAATAAQLATHADVIILCVTGSPQVEAVLTGDQGALKTLRQGAIVVDCSTAIPTSTERMAAQVRAAGGRFIDAPMTRTPKEAAEGRLNLLVGGDADLLDAVRPVLACFAENIMHAGPVGAGHRMKLLHNYVSLGTVTLISEAAACAQKAGIAAETFVDILARGGGGGVALERLKPSLLGGDPALKFSIANALKDLSYYTSMASEAGCDHRIATAVRSSLDEATREGDPNGFVPTIVSRIAARKS